MMFGIEYNLVQQIPFYQTLPNGEVAATVRLQHLTLLFQTFVMMNLFNMFNCRKIGSETDPQLNVFDSIHHNWWFLIVLLVELNVQYIMVSYPAICLLFMTTPLTFGMHLTAFILGLGSMAVCIGVKHTPFEWTKQIPSIEEKETEQSLTRLIDGHINRVQNRALERSLISK